MECINYFVHFKISSNDFDFPIRSLGYPKIHMYSRYSLCQVFDLSFCRIIGGAAIILFASEEAQERGWCFLQVD